MRNAAPARRLRAIGGGEPRGLGLVLAELERSAPTGDFQPEADDRGGHLAEQLGIHLVAVPRRLRREFGLLLGGKLVELCDKLLAAHPPLEAFTAWFETLAAYIRVKHGLGEALHNAAIQNAINETYAPVVAAVTKLLDACVADNSARRGLDPADVLLLMGYLWRVAPDEDGIRQGRRLTQIVLDGIRTGRPGDDHA